MYFISSVAYAGSCTAVKGTTVTISATCNNGLKIKKNVSHVTINSGVIVKDDEQAILTTTGSTNTTIINNGTIKATDDQYGIYNQGIITTTFQYQELSYKSKAETKVYVYYTVGL